MVGPSGETTLSTRGRSAKVNLNLTSYKTVSFSAEHLDNFQVNAGVSSRVMKKVTNLIRTEAGRKAVPAYCRTHVSEKNKSLDSFYDTKIDMFDVEGETKKEKKPIVYTDFQAILEKVVEKRNIIGSPIVKLMADGGQGFLKLCATIIPPNYSPELDRSLTEEELFDSKEFPDFDLAYSKRTLYKDGGTVGKKGRLTSVKRLILICIVHQVKEFYSNMKILFDLCQVNKVSFKFVADFKLI